MVAVGSGDLIRAAREDVGMTLAELAAAAGLPIPELRRHEEGVTHPSTAVLSRITSAANLRPSIPLALQADLVVELAEQHHLRNVRVFGSIVRGRDTGASDIDLLVDLTPATSLFDLGGFAHEVEALVGIPFDVLVNDDLGQDPFFSHVLEEAVPL